jgi:hypothetical protein
MHPSIMQELAKAHIAELRRTAEAANLNTSDIHPGSARRRIGERPQPTSRIVMSKLRPRARRRPCPTFEEL